MPERRPFLTLGDMWTFPSRRSWLADAAIALVVGLLTVGGTIGASTGQDDRTLGGALGVGLLIMASASMFFLRRQPVVAMAGAYAGTLTYWSLGYARGPVFLPMIIALVNLVWRGYRREAIVALVAGFVGFPWLGYLLDRDDAPGWAHVLGLGAWLVALVSISETVKYRRDQRAAAAQSQAEAARRHATEERMHIARELHDVVAHNMSLISIQAGVALHLLDQNPDQARESLALIKDASKEALVELRSILGVLRQVDDESRQPVPSLDGLDGLVDHAAGSGVDVRLEAAAGVVEGVPRPIGLAAYRIVQEALTNVAKHSDHKAAVVRIDRDDGDLVVEVLDEGTHRGPTEVRNEGLGLVGMKERAASVGGRVDAGPRPGRGFAVRAWLPMSDEVDA